MITYLKDTDLFTVEADIYAHGCNCIGKMGAGIAASFAVKWPEMLQLYKVHCSKTHNPADLAGSIFWFWTDEKYPTMIANMFTQILPGRHAQISFLQRGLRALFCLNEFSFAMPAIGCGIGGLKFEDFQAVLTEEHDKASFKPNVTVCLKSRK